MPNQRNGRLLKAFFSLCFLVVCLALCGASASTVQVEDKERIPIPPMSEQKAVHQFLRETYKVQLAGSTDEAKCALATQLLDKAKGFDKDPTGRYVYLDRARQLSLEASNLDYAFVMIGEIEQHYIVDGLKLRTEAVGTVAQRSKKEEADAIADFVLGLLSELISSGDPNSAEGFLRASQSLAGNLSELTKRKWDSAAWHVRSLKRAEQERQRLVEEPDNERALTILGRYLCLVMADFEQGLPMLSRSSDKSLQQLAEADLRRPVDAEAQELLADRWLAVAKEYVLEERHGAACRAVYWYEKAIAHLAGTSRGDVLTSRLGEARSLERSALLDLSPELSDPQSADETNTVGPPDGSRREVPRQLLKNPSCEEPATGSEIPGWASVQGSWVYRNQGPEPQHGEYYFFPGANERAELAQNVSLSDFHKSIQRGQARIEFQCYLASWNPYDTLQVIIEARGSAGKILGTCSSGDRNCSQSWELYSNTLALPPATKSVSVRLISVRHEGKNNDGYFDNLSLTVVTE